MFQLNHIQITLRLFIALKSIYRLKAIRDNFNTTLISMPKMGFALHSNIMSAEKWGIN
jgi:hypothetical protein